MRSHPSIRRLISTLALVSACTVSQTRAQFIDEFESPFLTTDPRGTNGWTFFTGDGWARMEVVPSGKGTVSIVVDASSDTMGIWWALIRRRVSENMDLGRLRHARTELRIEARIKSSHSPRRVNLHLNTQRTVDFHSHLMEFDIGDTTGWHTISMTTKEFDAVPGDSVYGQLALMDWGLERYRVEVDYLKVDVVNIDSAGPDKGVQVPYRPPVPDPRSFRYHTPVSHDAIVDLDFPGRNFNTWSGADGETTRALLAVGGSRWTILRWDFSRFREYSAAGSGVLELTTFNLERLRVYRKDFGMVRISEIVGGDPGWDQETVTLTSLKHGLPLNRVVNEQMIMDVEVNPVRGGKTLITISRPVLQRLLEGRSLGLAIRSLGAIHASFSANEKEGGREAPILHWNGEVR